MKKIITVLGARPQFIKAAMISHALQQEREVKEIIIHTGQHHDSNMSDIFFQEMDIPSPAYNLGISGGDHGEMTGKMMIDLEQVIKKEKPDLVMLYGDTNSTLAGALVARKLNIPIAHIEAGLRNFDMTVPEDVNRILTDRVSDLLFCPTDIAIENLKNEGFSTFPCKIIKTGDLMCDAVQFFASKTAGAEGHSRSIQGEYVLCTIHRAYNTSPPGIFEVFKALNKIAENYHVVFPAHPRTQKSLNENQIKLYSGVTLLSPQGYLAMIGLLKNSQYVITDSGGLQKEAYALGKKSLLLMNYTPWEELVQNQFSVVTEIEEHEILLNWKRLQDLSPDFSIKLYGDGNTSSEIVDHIKKMLFNCNTH